MRNVTKPYPPHRMGCNLYLKWHEKEGKELFVDENGEVWTGIKSTLPGSAKEKPICKLSKKTDVSRKENAELHKAIEETLRELNDAGFADKSILIMWQDLPVEEGVGNERRSS